MIVIGLTGGIGSGKSTVAKIFQGLGVPVFDSDAVGKRLMIESEGLKSAILATFGETSYLPDGSLNRKFLSDKVFSDREALAELNGLVHPAVGAAFERWVSEQHSTYVIKEAAILFESGANQQCDKVIAVTANKEVRIDRVTQRDGVTKEKVITRMKQQWPQERILESSDFHIDNSGEKAVIPQVLAIHQKMT